MVNGNGFCNVLQVFCVFTSIALPDWCLRTVVLPVLLVFGRSFPGCAYCAKWQVDYECVSGLFRGFHAGDRIRGNSLSTTILPVPGAPGQVLHTGQSQNIRFVSTVRYYDESNEI